MTGVAGFGGVKEVRMDNNAAPSVGELWLMLQQQRIQHQEEIARLEARIERQEAQLEEQRRQNLARATQPHETHAGETRTTRRFTRAGMMKAAAAGAAGVVGIAALRPGTASADDGNSLIIGQANTASSYTTLALKSGSTTGVVLSLDATTSGGTTDCDALTARGNGGFAGIYTEGGTNAGVGIQAFGGQGGGAGTTSKGGWDPGDGRTTGGDGVDATGGLGGGYGVLAQGGNGSPTYPDSGLGVFGSAGTPYGGGNWASGVVGYQASPVASRTAGVVGASGLSAGIGMYALGGSGGTGMLAETADGTGIGISASVSHGVGIQAQSAAGFGVHCIGFPGFLAEGATYNGVVGRGGRFLSSQAPIRLMPAAASQPPSTGQLPGDFFVSSDGHLWYYNGTQWTKLA